MFLRSLKNAPHLLPVLTAIGVAGLGVALSPAMRHLPVLMPSRPAAPSIPLVTVTPPVKWPQPIFDAENAMPLEARLARWSALVDAASRRFGVPADWITAVMRQESAGHLVLDGDMPITSITGAMGLMQVMPQTYAEMRAGFGLGPDPYDPHDNVMAGTAYLKWLHGKYGYPAMFAAYNDGPGNIDLNLAGKHELPAETVAYLANIRTRLGDKAPPDETPGGKSATVVLTRPDGQTVRVTGLDVKSVRAVLPGEYPPGALAVVETAKGRQAVREDVAAATQMLRLAGARL